MRSLALVSWIAVAACGGTSAPPVAPATAPVKAFEPTSFGVAVSGHGRPVILIPGLGCPGSVWDETVAHLSTHETHVLTLSGFAGRAPITAPLAATVRVELAAYIRDRHLDHPIVIGHSLGGFIAYWLAETEPDLVGPVIIVDAAPALGAAAGSEEQARGLRDAWR